jgi:hypothetical protein
VWHLVTTESALFVHGNEEKRMKQSISYKNCLIQSQSFQLAINTSWIPQFTVTPGTMRNAIGARPTHHARLDQVFWSETEADEFALQDAMRWIDSN